MNELADQVQKLLGIRLTRTQMSALDTYERELLAWNAQYNLTAIDEPERIRTKHFLDSMTCLLAMKNTPVKRVIDVGTGAGFPGIPLKIVAPKIQLTLVESVGKKANFCEHIVRILKLTEVEVVRARAEDLGCSPTYRQQFDWALARAVASLPILVEYLLPLVRVGGRALAMKGESGPAEAQAAEQALHLLGGHLLQLIPVSLPGVVDQRFLVIIEKVAATPNGYPRRVGIPTKRPLQ
jgi:16S rRNA (guanine527-N7)-methyltransferase